MQHHSSYACSASEIFCRFWARALWPPCLSLVACATDDLSIGADPPPPVVNVATNPNCEQGEEYRRFHTRNQADIDAIAGCEELQGDLLIDAFQDMDLRPLESLRVVHGYLMISAHPILDGSTAPPLDDSIALPDVHVKSLAGLESLEQVSGLELMGLEVPDLSDFASLSRIRRDSTSYLGSGDLDISNCDELKDLSGLGRLSEWGTLMLQDDAKLESLRGLQPPGFLPVDLVLLQDLPRLRDVSALAAVQVIGQDLYFMNTGVENLDDLRLNHLSRLDLYNNPALLQIDSLHELRGAESITIDGNPLLDHLPEMPYLQQTDSVEIIGNATLRSIPTFWAGGKSISRYEVANNTQLVDVAAPYANAAAQYLSIHDNPSLTHLDLSSFQNVDFLSIQDNATLSDLDIGSLATVDELHVANNPRLSVADFARVKTFERDLTDNLDAPAP